jgi:hypothetical protein
MKKVFFGDVVAFNFFQLENGKWAGRNSSNVYVTVTPFPKGVSPERFKHERCVRATPKQSKEYLDAFIIHI